jgi:Uri superfamily endonuclease
MVRNRPNAAETPLNGTYLLMMRLDSDLDALQVGRLGVFGFAAGYYLYVGSAFGPGGLPARLAYHARRVKLRPHWHIDYLRPHARLLEAWSVSGAPPLERAWVQALEHLPGVAVPVPGFGARDTARRAHLFYAPRRPGTRQLTGTVLSAVEQVATPPYAIRLEITIYHE